MSGADLYFSVDIESDGPIPVKYSMLAIGLCVAARFDGRVFEPFNAEERTFYRELKPISDEFVEEAMEVTGLDRAALVINGAAPTDAMTAAREWVEAQAGGDRPVLVGFPLVFDWMFVTWYLERFAGGSPFGYSSGVDMKSLYVAKARVPVSRAGKDDLPATLLPNRPHTHNALDDALEQAQIFVKLFDWDP